GRAPPPPRSPGRLPPLTASPPRRRLARTTGRRSLTGPARHIRRRPVPCRWAVVPVLTCTTVRRPQTRAARLAVVGELKGEVELLALQQRDHGLQVVLLLGRDAQLLALDLGPDALRPLVPDDLRQLPGVVLVDALLEGDRHAVLLPGELGIGRVQRLQRYAALDQLVLEHVEDGHGALLAVGADVHGLLAGPGDGRAHAAEVEPGTYFLGRLVERVVNFLAVEFGHDVKGRLLGCHGTRSEERR